VYLQTKFEGGFTTQHYAEDTVNWPNSVTTTALAKNNNNTVRRKNMHNTLNLNFTKFRPIFTARRYASALYVYAVVVCPSDRHKPALAAPKRLNIYVESCK